MNPNKKKTGKRNEAGVMEKEKKIRFTLIRISPCFCLF